MNDSVVSKFLKCILFADDTTFFSGENNEQMLDMIQTEFRKVKLLSYRWIWIKQIILTTEAACNTAVGNKTCIIMFYLLN